MDMKIVRKLASLLILFGCALTCLPARAGTITIGGNVVGSGSDPEDDAHAKEYSGAYTVTFVYTIATTVGPDNEIMWDPNGTNSVTATDTSEKWGSFTTLPITITSANVSPTDGTPTSFMFQGHDWYPNAATNQIENNGISGSVNITNGTATVTSSYIETARNSTYTYVFTVPEPAGWAPTLVGVGLVSLRRRRCGRRSDHHRSAVS
jgi:hypothetical protein